MTPAMGAGGLGIGGLAGVPYTSIMAAALPPAVLYFFAVWVGINAFSHRYELKGLPREERPTTKDVVITSGFFLVPFTILIWGMFIAGYTPQYAASYAIFAGALLLILDGKLGLDWRRTADRAARTCITAGQQIAMIASIILCASIVIGVLSITGLGVKITSLILSGSGGMLWPAILLTAIACLILGMEVPTTAAYVICVSVAGPALMSLGLEPLQAHLFVFWFALLSTITPPVCGTVFIASGMVGENWLRVAVMSMALGIGLYLIPLGMIANPSLIELAESPMTSVAAALKLAVALSAISYGLIAPKPPLLRAALTLAGGVVLFAFGI